VETHQSELWFLAFFRSAIAISERRTSFCIHATVCGMLGAFSRYGLASKKQVWKKEREGRNETQ